jgi:hypothetical protein
LQQEKNGAFLGAIANAKGDASIVASPT